MNTVPVKHDRSQKYDRVRAAAVEALIAVEKGKQTEVAIREVLSGRKFSPLDIRFLLQLVNGATKMLRRLDHEIKFYLARPAAPLSDHLRNILRIGFYQLLFNDRVPDAAAVSESVNLARHYLDKPRSRLVNAVLRTRLREPNKVKFVACEKEPEKYLADYYSFPNYFVRYCLDEFGLNRTEAMLKRFNLPPSITYRVNLLHTKPAEVIELLTAAEIGHAEGKYLPEFLHLKRPGLPLESELIATGKVMVQDESAGLPVRLLNPRPGEKIVDLTAAPGGKATYAAMRMRNKGRVTAVDKSHNRLRLLVENIERQGIKIIAPVVSDMSDFGKEEFDRVLLDPPCSGWGTAGKHSDLRWAKTPQDIDQMVKIQTKMIDRAARLVKPGGVMVYSTCTVIRKENDQVVEEFLVRNREFQLESAADYFPKEIVSDRGFVKTYPECDGMDGAFCARLKRKLK